MISQRNASGTRQAHLRSCPTKNRIRYFLSSAGRNAAADETQDKQPIESRIASTTNTINNHRPARWPFPLSTQTHRHCEHAFLPDVSDELRSIQVRRDGKR